MAINSENYFGKIKHMVSSRDLTLSILIQILNKAVLIKKIMKEPGGNIRLLQALRGKKICNVFYQPSTRTIVSSGLAGAGLGAYVRDIIGTKVDGEYQLIYSSLYAKGAAFLDEMMTLAKYFDLLNMRTPRVGMPLQVAEKIDKLGLDVSVINSGDGPEQIKDLVGEHPTQALIDIYTFLGGFNLNIERDWQKLPAYSIAFINDCRFSRSVMSDALLMGKLLRMELKFVFPEGLGPRENLLRELTEAKVRFSLHNELQPASAAYVVRIPEDWIGREKYLEFVRSRNSFSITRDIADKYGYEGVMHPFPRSEEGNELPSYETAGENSLDSDHKAWYTKQEQNGVPMRMAADLTLIAPNLDLNKLKLNELNASFNAQCNNCGRLCSMMAGWGSLKSERYRELPLLPFCPECLKS